MNTYIFFLGRQEELAFVELTSALRVAGLGVPRKQGKVAFLEAESIPDNLIDILGGVDRIAQMITIFDHSPTPADILNALPEVPRKWSVGFSAQSPTLAPKLKKFGTDFKAAAKEKNSKVTFIAGTSDRPQLNAAQVAFNKLDVPPHAEFTFIESEDGVIVARTLQIQDISAYEKRDTGKPARDPKSGMLPPKLAQIMLNIAIGQLPDELKKSPIHILDPFCGSGVVLQEGWLADYQMHGSDAEVKAVEASKENLDWLAKQFRMDRNLTPEVIGRNVKNAFPSPWRNLFSAVVTEPYLGPPVKSPLIVEVADKRISELAAIYRPAFKNFHSLLKTGGVVAFLFPVFFTRNGWAGFPNPIIDGLTQIGYRIVQLSEDERGLLYKRPDALVARELIIFQKI